MSFACDEHFVNGLVCVLDDAEVLDARAAGVLGDGIEFAYDTSGVSVHKLDAVSADEGV